MDGWKATRNAWKALFTSVVIICCFLHVFIKIRDRAKKKYNTRAEQILFDKAKAVSGVKDGEGNIDPAKAVIANCPVPALVKRMIPQEMIPESFIKKAAQRKVSRSSFVVWLGLDKPIKHIKNYEIDLKASKTGQAKDRLTPVDPAEADIGIALYDKLFKGYSPPGKSTLSIISLADYGYWKKYAADYFNDEKDAYNEEKERIAKRFIRRVETALIPGLSGMIEVMEVGTPLTNVLYTGNTNGAIYGYERDMPHLKAKTPIKGLYLSSAWSYGGGYTPVMMGGREAAKIVLKDFQK